MKFTNGYWLTRPEYEMLYARELHRVERRGNGLHVLATTSRTGGDRGALILSLIHI